MEIRWNVIVQYPRWCTVKVIPRLCHKLEGHELEANEKGDLTSGSEDDTKSPVGNSWKVSVILEYAERNASSIKPAILVSLCTTLLWNMVYYSDHSY